MAYIQAPTPILNQDLEDLGLSREDFNNLNHFTQLQAADTSMTIAVRSTAVWPDLEHMPDPGVDVAHYHPYRLVTRVTF